jgi:CheY-like chemotaxis protein
VPIVKEVVKFLQATIPAGIRIEMEAAPDLQPIMGDPTQIHQVLMNLCTNAAHAMGMEGGNLKIGLGRGYMKASPSSDFTDSVSTACLSLRVVDTGHGMPTEIMERAFEPYFTTKPQGAGTGLGLAVVHGIVKSHGGTLAVKSQPGRGTEFKIKIPFTHKDCRPESQACRDWDLTGTARILFVDDELAITDMCNSMLADLGYQVRTFCDGAEALDLFQEQSGQFDLVITDLCMPTMNGVQLACRIKEIRPDVPIILCTGYVTSTTEEMVSRVGIDALMRKPVLMVEMAETIRKTLERRAKK